MKTSCPHCGQHYSVENSLLNEIVSCEKCKQEFVVEFAEERSEKKTKKRISYNCNGRPKAARNRIKQTGGNGLSSCHDVYDIFGRNRRKFWWTWRKCPQGKGRRLFWNGNNLFWIKREPLQNRFTLKNTDKNLTYPIGSEWYKMVQNGNLNPQKCQKTPYPV